MTDSPPPVDPTPASAPATAPPPAGPRRRPVWKWTRRVLGVGVAALAGLVVSFLSIDLGRFPAIKREAEKAASAYLERPMHIGRIRAHVRPGWFSIEDVVIEGKGESRPFFTAKQIIIQLSWSTLFKRDLLVSADILDWKMAVEKWPTYTNVPRLTPKSTGPKKKRPFTTTAVVFAKRGEFYFEDHGTRWSVLAPNMNFALVRAQHLQKYVGNVAFDGGTVQIQESQPLATALSARFTLDGSLVNLHHIDLLTDGAQSHVSGVVDFSRWPEQTYNVRSTVDFKRNREIFFARETWDVGGTGTFTGIFKVFKDSKDAFNLAGDFASRKASVGRLEFPNLHGSLEWRPNSFQVTHADADVFGGRTRFAYAIAPIGAPGGATHRFSAELADVDARAASRHFDWGGIVLDGRARGRVTLAWPGGQFGARREGDVEMVVTPPAGVALARATLPALVPEFVPARRSLGEGGPDWPEFDPFQSLGLLPVGGEIRGRFDADGLTFQESWAATPATYVSFQGRTNSTDSALPFHVATTDWQASARLLSAILTAVTGPSKAIEVNGHGTFDGMMTQSFSAPRIKGRFMGEAMRVWNVRWGRATGDIDLHDRYVDITNGVIGDTPDRSIQTTGRYSTEIPRKDADVEIDAKVKVVNWPMDDLRTAFEMNDWAVDGTIAEADLQLRGPYKGPFGAGQMRIERGEAWGEKFDRATGQLAFNGRGVEINQLQMTKGTGLVKGDASLQWDSRYAFSATGTRIPVESLDNFRTEGAPLTGFLSFRASGASSFDSPKYEVHGEIESLFVGDQGLGLVRGSISVTNNVMTISTLDVTSPLLTVVGSGQIALNDAYDANLTLQFVESKLDPFLQFLESAPRFTPYLAVIASGSLRVVGPLKDRAHLGATARIEAATVTVVDYELKNDGDIVLQLVDDGIRIGSFKMKGEGTALTLTGGVSFANKTLDLQADGDANLGILQTADLRANGQATLKAGATGSWSDPTLSGTANITNGELRYDPLRNGLTNINGSVRFDERAIVADGLRATFASGEAVFGGSITLDRFVPSEFNLSLSGRSMRLLYPVGFSSTVNAALTLTGPVSAPVLGGDVDVIKVLTLPQANQDVGLLGLAAGGVAGGGGAAAPTAAPITPGSGVPLRYNIRIRAPERSLVFENRAVDARLMASGFLDIGGTYDEPEVRGNVEIDSGGVNFNGNRITIQSGSIEFVPMPGVPFNPYFNIRAESRARGSGQTFQVNLGIEGTPKSLKFSVTSDPWLPESDIITLLLGANPDVGTVEERALQSTQQAQSSILQSAAAQIIMSPLAATAGNLAGRIPGASVAIPLVLSGETSQLNPSAKFVYGQRLSSRLFLTYTRTLTLTGLQSDVVLVEYEQTDRVSWVLSRNEDRSFALDFYIRRVF